ncbi:hypothetical protein EJ110_NYTH30994 [Nymphaea thermarum]|nr:hypothetical protein EJ110_NYTH30994 [Nymphaea thermarum]
MLYVPANEFISDDTIVHHTLNGLSTEYESFITSITTMKTLPTFAEMYDLLLNHEKRLQNMNRHSLQVENFVAFFSQRGRGCKRFYRGRGTGRQQYNGNQSKGYYQNQGNCGFKDSISTNQPIVCQLCGRKNHTARQCYDIPKVFAVIALGQQPTDTAREGFSYGERRCPIARRGEGFSYEEQVFGGKTWASDFSFRVMERGGGENGVLDEVKDMQSPELTVEGNQCEGNSKQDSWADRVAGRKEHQQEELPPLTVVQGDDRPRIIVREEDFKDMTSSFRFSAVCCKCKHLQVYLWFMEGRDCYPCNLAWEG